MAATLIKIKRELKRSGGRCIVLHGVHLGYNRQSRVCWKDVECRERGVGIARWSCSPCCISVFKAKVTLRNTHWIRGDRKRRRRNAIVHPRAPTAPSLELYFVLRTSANPLSS